ncbi:MAG: asparagine synthase (glutamine-hydrolyzing) [Flavipsychrobacter sp.]
MCGITGFIRFRDEVAASVLESMNNTIRHRGPDDEGYVCINAEGVLDSYFGEDSVEEIKHKNKHIQSAGTCSVGLGFRRLSIIDLSYHGHQPMVSKENGIALSFNGEVYNYRELRLELSQLGARFVSDTDTEVILRGYEQWGISVVEKLNGMFAFVLVDNKKSRLFLVRDRVGIKPLFYHRSNEGITWASEIKAVLKAPWVKPDVNWDGVFANYQLQTTPYPYTCFKNISSIEPASFLEVDINTNKVTKVRYWDIPVDKEKQTISEQAAAKELEARLEQIVSMQLRSDVPVTSLMSGGIDSTTLTAMCVKKNSNFHAYTLGFDGTGEGADELPQAIAMAKKLGVKHHVHYLKPEDVLNNLDATLKHFEEPYSNLEPGFAASDYLHKEGYKVVMNGLGADEVFGGYAYYLSYMKWQLRLRYAKYNKLIPALSDTIKKVKYHLEIDTVLKFHTHHREGMKTYELPQLTSMPVLSLAEMLSDDKGSSLLDIPEALFYYDMRNYVGAHHVYRDDLSAMAHSVEMRYPFLDHELIEWVATLPINIRYSTIINKPLLRKVSEKYVTHDNLIMPKKGFSLPLNKWLQKDNSIQDYANEKLTALKKRQLFNNATIDKWWKRKDEGVYFTKLWQLVTTEVWLSEYIEA